MTHVFECGQCSTSIKNHCEYGSQVTLANAVSSNPRIRNLGIERGATATTVFGWYQLPGDCILISRGKEMRTVQECKCCGENTRVRSRDFSPQAWAFLMHWEEIDSSVIGQPICSSCYNDLRELLIERSGEIERTLAADIANHQLMVAQALAKREVLADTPIAS